jgi:hypothetical protein
MCLLKRAPKLRFDMLVPCTCCCCCRCCCQVTAVGEVMLEVGAPQGWGPSRLSSQQLARVLAALQQAAAQGGADATVLRQGSTEMAAEGEGAG